ncbi:MAG: hypothetical protein IJT01_12320 [Selenomonadaceae bacterium]|nr:hypothetical protein [Selenomonadaceae bacterium]
MKYSIKKICAMGMAAGALLLSGQSAIEAVPALPKDTFEWVQSTARAGYYFNKEQMCYAVDKEGYIDLNRLIVPTVKAYDPVQIEDVVAKRRWRMMRMDGYDTLAGAADYLEFNLEEKTVRITEHNDLDDGWNPLSVEKNYGAVNLESYGEKDVDGKFYRAILEYAAAHQEEIIAHTKGELREADKEKLEEAKNPSKDGDKKDKK